MSCLYFGPLTVFFTAKQPGSAILTKATTLAVTIQPKASAILPAYISSRRVRHHIGIQKNTHTTLFIKPLYFGYLLNITALPRHGCGRILFYRVMSRYFPDVV
jgi:hypothetical protein